MIVVAILVIEYRDFLGVIVHALNHWGGREKQVDLCEVQASLGYILFKQ